MCSLAQAPVVILSLPPVTRHRGAGHQASCTASPSPLAARTVWLSANWLLRAQPPVPSGGGSRGPKWCWFSLCSLPLGLLAENFAALSSHEVSTGTSELLIQPGQLCPFCPAYLPDPGPPQGSWSCRTEAPAHVSSHLGSSACAPHLDTEGENGRDVLVRTLVLGGDHSTAQ